MQCSYGCGQEAKFTLKNGRQCCSKSWNSCPAIRAKNSKGVAAAHADGRIPNPPAETGAVYRELRVYQKIQSGEILFESLGYRRKREYILWKYEHRCSRCGLSTWQGEDLVLEVDHIDGNHQNNEEANLQPLCPNCHSLTPTHRNKQHSNKRKVEDADLIKAYQQTKNTSQALLAVGLSNSVGNRKRLLSLIEKSEELRKLFLETATMTIQGNSRIIRRAVY